MFLEQQIILLELFLKDHVTLKTGVMMLKIHHMEENTFITLLYSVSKYIGNCGILLNTS